MTTLETATLTVTIDAAFDKVANDLADPMTHPEWATAFFSGKPEPIGENEYRLSSPVMGGEINYRVEADPGRGAYDLFVTPVGVPYGQPIPVRLLPNLDGVDVLWTLARMPGQDDQAWQMGLESMRKELLNLKLRHESAA